MKNKTKYFILFCFLISLQIVRAQSLWEFKVSPFLIIGVRGDTTISNLYEILNNDSLKYSSQFSCAAKLLSIYEKENVKDFVLGKIGFWGDKTSQLFSINKFLDLQLFKGYYGDETVIATLDSLINSSQSKDIQLSAISYLCEANFLNYFEVVKSLYEDRNYSLRSVGILGKYGNDIRYKQEVINLLSGIVIDSTDFSLIHVASISLASLDSILNVELLNNRFYNSIGDDRYFFFSELDLFDYQNQMNRSKWVIPREENEEIREKYIPFYFEEDKNLALRGYNSPVWINFIKGRLNVESSLIARFNIKTTLESFIPIKPDSTTQTFDLLNNLYNYVDSVYNYSWLGDLPFSNELKNILTTAKTNLQNGDSLACRVQVKAFQDLVDNVYKDSLNTDPRFITIEGWKFLYWNAQYILDRLPENN